MKGYFIQALGLALFFMLPGPAWGETENAAVLPEAFDYTVSFYAGNRENINGEKVLIARFRWEGKTGTVERADLTTGKTLQKAVKFLTTTGNYYAFAETEPVNGRTKKWLIEIYPPTSNGNLHTIYTYFDKDRESLRAVGFGVPPDVTYYRTGRIPTTPTVPPPAILPVPHLGR